MTVLLDMAISLDGFAAGKNDADGGLHQWYFNPSREDQTVIDELIGQTGAIIMGRRSYDMGDQYDGFVDNPYRAAHFVLTHSVPERRAKGAEDFVFVTDGIESALRQAREAAGEKNIVVSGGARTAQQFLKAGLITEIQLHLVPVILGEGVRLFDGHRVQLELKRTVVSPNVTHLRYRVMP
jgi:dihydrofolate reductase